MNKLEDFLSRESQIRSRLDPLELDLDSLGQGRTLDLMFDRVRELVQHKTHFDHRRFSTNPEALTGSAFERNLEKQSKFRES